MDRVNTTGTNTSLMPTVLGRWLSEEYDWTHFGSYTFRGYEQRYFEGFGPPRPSPATGPSEAATRATRRCWEKYCRRVSRAAHREIGFFVAFEPGGLLGRLHIHALLADAQNLSADLAERLWFYGRSLVELYDTSRGAAYYAAKFAGRECADWDVGGSLVRRRSRGR
jgi:hypothetical protein